jgi:hypothetical protein
VKSDWFWRKPSPLNKNINLRRYTGAGPPPLEEMLTQEEEEEGRWGCPSENPVDPQHETARLQTLSLSLDPS